METAKTRRLTPEQHAARLASGVCPRCFSHRIVRSVRVSEPDQPGRAAKYLGEFYHCSSESGHKCWYMSSASSKDIRESAIETDPVAFRIPSSAPSQVIRRKKG